MEIEEKQLRSYIRVMFQRKGLIIAITFLFAIISAMATFFMKPAFTAYATMVPSLQNSSSSMSGLLNLTSQFGLTDMSGSDPSKLLFDIIQSNVFTDKILHKKFHFQELDKKATFYEYHEVPDTGQSLERYQLLEKFKTNIQLESIKNSELFKLSVSAPEPELARDLADTIIAELNNSYETLRSAKKTKYRKIVAENLKQAEIELELSEDSLKLFMENNKTFRESPRLLLEQQRKTREVNVGQEIFLTIRKSFEIARLEEQKELNALEILDSPEIPMFKTKPQRRKIVMLFSFIGMMLGILLAFVVEYKSDIYGIYRDISEKDK